MCWLVIDYDLRDLWNDVTLSRSFLSSTAIYSSLARTCLYFIQQLHAETCNNKLTVDSINLIIFFIIKAFSEIIAAEAKRVTKHFFIILMQMIPSGISCCIIKIKLPSLNLIA